LKIEVGRKGLYNPGKPICNKINSMRKLKILPLAFILIVIMASCQSRAGEVSPEDPDQKSPTTTITTPRPTLLPSLTPTPVPTFTPTVTPIVILDPVPIQIHFQTEDEVWLSGTYYPADVNPAPLIVLMHWAKGDQSEWDEIAAWLQGRGLLEPAPDYNHSWKSSVWFPDRILDKSIGIFTFNFRECDGACKAYLPMEWLLDVEAAMDAAANLQGANVNQIITAGASIGADGAIYGCSWLNIQEKGACRGTFLLSPGSTLTIPFDSIVGKLFNQEPPVPVYCLIGLRDDASVETCSDITGLTLVDYGYIENHGFELLQPGVGTNPLVLLQELINIALTGE